MKCESLFAVASPSFNFNSGQREDLAASGGILLVAALLVAAVVYRLQIRRLRGGQKELVAHLDSQTKELQEEILQRREIQHQLHEQIVERNRVAEKVEAAARTKDEFLAGLNHEIRTPLNGVVGALDLTALTELTAEQKELLHMCRSSANALLTVLND